MKKEQIREEYERRFFIFSHTKWSAETQRYETGADLDGARKLAIRTTNDFEFFAQGVDFALSSNVTNEPRGK